MYYIKDKNTKEKIDKYNYKDFFFAPKRNSIYKIEKQSIRRKYLQSKYQRLIYVIYRNLINQ